MLPKLAQGPKHKVAKDGSTYVVIPMKHTTASASGIRTEPKERRTELATALRSIQKDKNIKWKKYRHANLPNGEHATMERMQDALDIPDNLKGLVRVRQYKEGKKRPYSSYYLTFRVASTKHPEKFIHPGYVGLHAFPKIEEFIDQNLNTIVQNIFNSQSYSGA